ncbi:MAG: hypothetical protein IPH59_10545 [bacterium]|nr:hypothetical protein [bacterium]
MFFFGLLIVSYVIHGKHVGLAETPSWLFITYFVICTLSPVVGLFHSAARGSRKFSNGMASLGNAPSDSVDSDGGAHSVLSLLY